MKRRQRLLLLPLLGVVAAAADADVSASSSVLPMRGISPGSRCTKLIMPAWLSSSKELRERARSAMIQVKLMALDEHPSCLRP